MVEPLRHRQTKGAETDMLGLTPPRHTSTLPKPASRNGQMVIRRGLHDPALDAFDGTVRSTRPSASEPDVWAQRSAPGAPPIADVDA
jgi:hypothetical protein